LYAENHFVPAALARIPPLPGDELPDSLRMVLLREQARRVGIEDFGPIIFYPLAWVED
jgi:hypothetical protein